MKVKTIVDVCCGSRMFWFDRHNPKAVFIDLRNESITLKDKSSRGGFRKLLIRPDAVADFTNLPLENNRFNLAVFDPPHFKRNGKTGWVAKKYGILPDNWRDVIRCGFSECFRVLKPNGVLVFKWNENEIKTSEVLSLTDEKPVIGHRSGKHMQTHWLVFMKGDL